MSILDGDTLVQSIVGISGDVTKRILDREQIVVLIVGVGSYVVLSIGYCESVAKGIVGISLLIAEPFASNEER